MVQELSYDAWGRLRNPQLRQTHSLVFQYATGIKGKIGNMKKSLLFVAMLLFCSGVGAQKLAIKPYVRYHTSVAPQTEPLFHYFIMEVPPSADIGNLMYLPVVLNENFTLANGWKYGVAIDYTFKNNLGFELGIDYFNTQKTVSNASEYNSYHSQWKYQSLSLHPLLTFALDFKSSTFIGKLGPSLNLSGLIMSDFSGDHKLTTCTFVHQLSLGYFAGIEYNYQLSDRCDFVAEMGIEHYKYMPEKARAKDEFLGSETEIIYANEVVYDTNPYIRYSHSRTERKESLLFKSVYLGVGIKYNLWRK